MSKKKNKKNKLKSCPFCGGKFKIESISSSLGYTRYYLSHKKPFKARDNHCPWLTHSFDNEQDCIDAWNHRE